MLAPYVCCDISESSLERLYDVLKVDVFKYVSR